MSKIDYDKTQRWLHEAAARSRVPFISDQFLDAAKAIKTLRAEQAEITEAVEKTIADIRLFSNSFDDGSASKDFCIGIENRLRSALDKAKGE